MVFIFGGRRIGDDFTCSHLHVVVISTGRSIKIGGRCSLTRGLGNACSDVSLPDHLCPEFSLFAEICLVTTAIELIGSNSGISVCY